MPNEKDSGTCERRDARVPKCGILILQLVLRNTQRVKTCPLPRMVGRNSLQSPLDYFFQALDHQPWILCRRFFVVGYEWVFWGRAEDQGFFCVDPVGSEVRHAPQVLAEALFLVSYTAVVVAAMAMGVTWRQSRLGGGDSIGLEKMHWKGHTIIASRRSSELSASCGHRTLLP